MLTQVIIKNEQEAFLTIVVSAAASVKDIKSEVWGFIYDTLSQKTIFETVDLWTLIEKCKLNIKEYDSIITIVSDCAPFIKQKNKKVVFSVCVNLILMNGTINEKEKTIIEFLKTQLSITDEFANKCIEVMLVHNTGNEINK